MAKNKDRGSILEGQTFWMNARLLGPNDAQLFRADITSGTLNVYDPKSATPDTAVHTITLLFAADPGTGFNCMFTALQTDGHWTKDNVGYAFQYGLTPSDYAMAGSKTYRIEVDLVTDDYDLLPMVWFCAVEERAG